MCESGVGSRELCREAQGCARAALAEEKHAAEHKDVRERRWLNKGMPRPGQGRTGFVGAARDRDRVKVEQVL